MLESGREQAFAHRQERNASGDKQGMFPQKDQLLSERMEKTSRVSLLPAVSASGSFQEIPLKARLLGMFTMLVKDGYFTQPNVDLPVIAGVSMESRIIF